ncbi:lipase 3 [Megachile rotundata]|uniref:lipase 3 n=1 Tax=Megachile rotundata TaxID=143995 RepID=UPI003FD25C65
MFKILLFSCLSLPIILGIPVADHKNGANDDDPFRSPTPSERAIDLGYEAETHKVTTEDGYILQLHRITGRQNRTTSGTKPAVLMLHGLLDCSATWVLSDPSRSLAFMLSDWGYDVWLGNVRGNRYSRKHVSMNVLDDDFWKFSWHEMGIYDLPAMIDYILKETKQEKIFYVGHSQGGTSFFVMASERPEYQKKLIATFALAPAVILPHTRNILFRLLAPIANDIMKLGELIGVTEFTPSSKLIQILGQEMCKEDMITQPICRNIIFLAGGIDVGLNMTLVPSVAKYDPAGASVRQVVHYAQLLNSGRFQQYDHGLIRNLRQYGSILPPQYDLSKVTMPVHIHYSTNDALVDHKDSIKLYKMLPNAQKLLVPNSLFAHLDFVWGKDVDTLLYNKIFSLMQRYKN